MSYHGFPNPMAGSNDITSVTTSSIGPAYHNSIAMTQGMGQTAQGLSPYGQVSTGMTLGGSGMYAQTSAPVYAGDLHPEDCWGDESFEEACALAKIAKFTLSVTVTRSGQGTAIQYFLESKDHYQRLTIPGCSPTTLLAWIKVFAETLGAEPAKFRPAI